MSGPDSISDPVARRISYTGSYTSARGSAPLNSRLMTWQVGPTLLTCQLTSRWHGMPTMHDDVTITSCWRHHYPGQSRGSGQPIRRRRRVARVGPICALGQTPCRRVTAIYDVRFWCCFHWCDRLFLLFIVVWSKHNFDNFHFWAKIKHH
jgi:hypothetical protein